MQPGSPYEPPASFEPSFVVPESTNERLTIKQVLFSFRGRIPRRTFWLWSVLTSLGAILIISLLAPLMAKGGTTEGIAWIVMMPFLFLLIWMGLAIRVKRWHDLDKSGWWVLIGMIPYVGGFIAFIYTGCIRGTDGFNRFGDDPT